jgi:hypothetical protein
VILQETISLSRDPPVTSGQLELHGGAEKEEIKVRGGGIEGHGQLR